jgi:hypothetical protein
MVLETGFLQQFQWLDTEVIMEDHSKWTKGLAAVKVARAARELAKKLAHVKDMLPATSPPSSLMDLRLGRRQ